MLPVFLFIYLFTFIDRNHSDSWDLPYHFINKKETDIKKSTKTEEKESSFSIYFFYFFVFWALSSQLKTIILWTLNHDMDWLSPCPWVRGKGEKTRLIHMDINMFTYINIIEDRFISNTVANFNPGILAFNLPLFPSAMLTSYGHHSKRVLLGPYKYQKQKKKKIECIYKMRRIEPGGLNKVSKSASKDRQWHQQNTRIKDARLKEYITKLLCPGKIFGTGWYLSSKSYIAYSLEIVWTMSFFPVSLSYP